MCDDWNTVWARISVSLSRFRAAHPAPSTIVPSTVPRRGAYAPMELLGSGQWKPYFRAAAWALCNGALVAIGVCNWEDVDSAVVREELAARQPPALPGTKGIP